MKTIPLLRALALVLTVTATALHAQVPQIINYQGRVAVGTVNFDGTGQFKFALVDAGGTTTYWSNDGTGNGGSEPDNAVPLEVSKGLYSVLLGDEGLRGMTRIPGGVFANPDVWLRVWFDDGRHKSQLLEPDQRIAAVAYSIMAANVPDGSITGAKIAGGAITSAQLAAGAVGSAQLAANLALPGTTTGTFSGNGSGLTNIPASAVAPPPSGMVLIPADAFTMGNSVAADTDITNAAPVSTTVSAFYMDVNEVTLSQWQSVYYWAKDNGYTDLPAGSGNGPNHPVQTVSWHDVVKWCNARSEQAGKTPVYYTDDAQTTIYKTGSVSVTNAQAKWSANGYRLPTEAEWEKAARGGSSGQRFPWGNTITQNLANYVGFTASFAYDLGPDGYNAIGGLGTTPVGSFAVNGYGLNDMAGNVWEWCWDRYGTPYAGGADPRGAASGSYRVFRGGSWGGNASFCRVAYRNYGNLSYTSNSIGFRTARSSVP